MGYAERFIIPQHDDRDQFLRECLRCEYMHGDRALRPDMPPDLVLQDQEPPDLILKDEVTGEMWELAFKEEITVTLYPYAQWWRTGIWLNDGWNIRMRKGEIKVSEEPLGEPSVYNKRGDPNFILEVVNGELVYTQLPPFSVIMRDLAPAIENPWWKVTFDREITVELWVHEPQEIKGILLNQGYEWQMWNGEIIATQEPSGGPWLDNTRTQWIDLRIVNGESVYRYRDRYVWGKTFFNIAWAIYFREEITVYAWEWVTPINGIMLAPESPTWALEMRAQEMVLEENVLPPVPYLPRKPDKWKFGLEMNENGEMVYTPYREADPRERVGNIGVLETKGIIPLEYGAIGYEA